MHDKTREEMTMGLPGIIGTVIFFLSFLPYIFLIYSAIFGIGTGFFGFYGFYGTLYGLKAVIYSGTMLILIPVLPVCFLYQVLFGVIYLRVRPKKIRIPAAICACVFAALIVIPCLVYKGREIVYSKEEDPEVRRFLEDKYGEQFAAEARIVLFSMENGEYRVYTPVLPDGEYFVVDRDVNTNEFNDHNDLIHEFACSNIGFTDDLDTYLDEKYGLPGNAHIHAECMSIDFGDFRNGDDHSGLLTNADYWISSIRLEPSIIDQESLKDITLDIWETYVPEFGDHMGEYITVYIYDGEEIIADIQIMQASFVDNGVPAGYIDAYENRAGLYGIEDEIFVLE